MNYIFSFLLGYLIGCINPAFFISKFIYKTDIRKHGSHNSGASNTIMVLGWLPGLITMVVDILKGLFTIIIARNLFGDITIVYFALLGAITGHLLPFYMNFKGGKGFATVIGGFLALYGWMAFFVIVSTIIIAVMVNYFLTSTILTIISFCVFTYIYQSSVQCFAISIIILFAITAKHIENFIKISRGEEPKMRKALKGKTSN